MQENDRRCLWCPAGQKERRVSGGPGHVFQNRESHRALQALVRLREANDRIVELHPEVVVQVWSVRALLDIVARCKLYDYDAHCWTDYDGVPTTACNFPVPSARVSEDVAAA